MIKPYVILSIHWNQMCRSQDSLEVYDSGMRSFTVHFIRFLHYPHTSQIVGLVPYLVKPMNQRTVAPHTDTLNCGIQRRRAEELVQLL